MILGRVDFRLDTMSNAVGVDLRNGAGGIMFPAAP